MRINIPNQITLGRLVLAIVFFGLLSFYAVGRPGLQWILPVCFWLFLIAALSDFVDGWLARTWGQVTSFGRVVDPVVDKVLVCGAFVFFAGKMFIDPDTGANITGVHSWMVVVILVRELLVSAIRAYAEAGGSDFSASWVGKVKMFVQSATACVVLGVLAWYPESLAWLRVTCVWGTVVITGLSIVSYVKRAHAFMLSAEAMGAVAPSPAKPKPSKATPAATPPPSDDTSKLENGTSEGATD